MVRPPNASAAAATTPTLDHLLVSRLSIVIPRLSPLNASFEKVSRRNIRSLGPYPEGDPGFRGEHRVGRCAAIYDRAPPRRRGAADGRSADRGHRLLPDGAAGHSGFRACCGEHVGRRADPTAAEFGAADNLSPTAPQQKQRQPQRRPGVHGPRSLRRPWPPRATRRPRTFPKGPGTTQPGILLIALPNADGSFEVWESVRLAAPVNAVMLEPIDPSALGGSVGETQPSSATRPDDGG